MRMLANLYQQATRLCRRLVQSRPGSAVTSLGTGALSLPPRFHELGRNDPIRGIVQRVALGETLTEDELGSLIRAAEDFRGSRWKVSLAAVWALGRASFPHGHRSQVIRALATLLQTRKWALTGCTGPLTVGCSLGTLVAFPAFVYLLIKDARLNAIRSEAATSLRMLGCVHAVGDLAWALSDRNRPGCAAVREAAREALMELLPCVTSAHEGQMPAGTEQRLVGS